MPVTWTTDNDRRLLLLVLELTKVNNADIAKRWAEKYASEEDQPTARAISERLYKLKNVAGSGKANGASSTPRKGTSTPSKVNKNTRTPTSNSKKRKIQSSDEEPSMSESKTDSEDEKKYIDPDRTTPSRRSIGRGSKLAKSYVESSDDAEVGPSNSQLLNGIARTNGFGTRDDDGNMSDTSEFGAFT